MVDNNAAHDSFTPCIQLSTSVAKGNCKDRVPVAVNWGRTEGIGYRDTAAGGDCFLQPVHTHVDDKDAVIAIDYVLHDSGLGASVPFLLDALDIRTIDNWDDPRFGSNAPVIPKKRVIGVIFTHFDGDHFEGFKKILSYITEKNDDYHYACLQIMKDLKWIVAPKYHHHALKPPSTNDLSKLTKDLIIEDKHLNTNDLVAAKVFAETHGNVIMKKSVNCNGQKCAQNIIWHDVHFDKQSSCSPPSQPVTKSTLNRTYTTSFDDADALQLLDIANVDGSIIEVPVHDVSFRENVIARNLGAGSPDDANNNRESITSVFISEYEGKKYFYYFCGDAEFNLATADRNMLPKNQKQYDELLSKVNNDVKIDVKKKLTDEYKALFSDEVQYCNNNNKCLHCTPKSSNLCSEIRSCQSNTSERFDMMQQAHHGSIKNCLAERQLMHDVEDIMKSTVSLSQGFFVTSPGTWYHADVTILEMLSPAKYKYYLSQAITEPPTNPTDQEVIHVAFPTKCSIVKLSSKLIEEYHSLIAELETPEYSRNHPIFIPLHDFISVASTYDWGSYMNKKSRFRSSIIHWIYYKMLSTLRKLGMTLDLNNIKLAFTADQMRISCSVTCSLLSMKSVKSREVSEELFNESSMSDFVTEIDTFRDKNKIDMNCLSISKIVLLYDKINGDPDGKVKFATANNDDPDDSIVHSSMFSQPSKRAKSAEDTNQKDTSKNNIFSKILHLTHEILNINIRHLFRKQHNLSSSENTTDDALLSPIFIPLGDAFSLFFMFEDGMFQSISKPYHMIPKHKYDSNIRLCMNLDERNKKNQHAQAAIEAAAKAAAEAVENDLLAAPPPPPSQLYDDSEDDYLQPKTPSMSIRRLVQDSFNQSKTIGPVLPEIINFFTSLSTQESCSMAFTLVINYKTFLYIPAGSLVYVLRDSTGSTVTVQVNDAQEGRALVSCTIAHRRGLDVTATLELGIARLYGPTVGNASTHVEQTTPSQRAGNGYEVMKSFLKLVDSDYNELTTSPVYIGVQEQNGEEYYEGRMKTEFTSTRFVEMGSYWEYNTSSLNHLVQLAKKNVDTLYRLPRNVQVYTHVVRGIPRTCLEHLLVDDNNKCKGKIVLEYAKQASADFLRLSLTSASESNLISFRYLFKQQKDTITHYPQNRDIGVEVLLSIRNERNSKPSSLSSGTLHSLLDCIKVRRASVTVSSNTSTYISFALGILVRKDHIDHITKSPLKVSDKNAYFSLDIIVSCMVKPSFSLKVEHVGFSLGFNVANIPTQVSCMLPFNGQYGNVTLRMCNSESKSNASVSSIGNTLQGTESMISVVSGFAFLDLMKHFFLERVSYSFATFSLTPVSLECSIRSTDDSISLWQNLYVSQMSGGIRYVFKKYMELSFSATVSVKIDSDSKIAGRARVFYTQAQPKASSTLMMTLYSELSLQEFLQNVCNITVDAEYKVLRDTLSSLLMPEISIVFQYNEKNKSTELKRIAICQSINVSSHIKMTILYEYNKSNSWSLGVKGSMLIDECQFVLAAEYHHQTKTWRLVATADIEKGIGIEKLMGMDLVGEGVNSDQTSLTQYLEPFHSLKLTKMKLTFSNKPFITYVTTNAFFGIPDNRWRLQLAFMKGSFGQSLEQEGWNCTLSTNNSTLQGILTTLSTYFGTEFSLKLCYKYNPALKIEGMHFGTNQTSFKLMLPPISPSFFEYQFDEPRPIVQVTAEVNMTSKNAGIAVILQPNKNNEQIALCKHLYIRSFGLGGTIGQSGANLALELNDVVLKMEGFQTPPITGILMISLTDSGPSIGAGLLIKDWLCPFNIPFLALKRAGLYLAWSKGPVPTEGFLDIEAHIIPKAKQASARLGSYDRGSEDTYIQGKIYYDAAPSYFYLQTTIRNLSISRLFGDILDMKYPSALPDLHIAWLDIAYKNHENARTIFPTITYADYNNNELGDIASATTVTAPKVQLSGVGFVGAGEIELLRDGESQFSMAALVHCDSFTKKIAVMLSRVSLWDGNIILASVSCISRESGKNLEHLQTSSSPLNNIEKKDQDIVQMVQNAFPSSALATQDNYKDGACGTVDLNPTNPKFAVTCGIKVFCLTFLAQVVFNTSTDWSIYARMQLTEKIVIEAQAQLTRDSFSFEFSCKIDLSFNLPQMQHCGHDYINVGQEINIASVDVRVCVHASKQEMTFTIDTFCVSLFGFSISIPKFTFSIKLDFDFVQIIINAIIANIKLFIEKLWNLGDQLVDFMEKTGLLIKEQVEKIIPLHFDGKEADRQLAGLSKTGRRAQDAATYVLEEGLRDPLGAGAKVLNTGIGGLGDAAGGLADFFTNNKEGNGVRDVFNDVEKGVSDGAQFVQEGVKTGVNEVARVVENSVNEVARGVENSVNVVARGVENSVNEVLNFFRW